MCCDKYNVAQSVLDYGFEMPLAHSLMSGSVKHSSSDPDAAYHPRQKWV